MALTGSGFVSSLFLFCYSMNPISFHVKHGNVIIRVELELEQCSVGLG